MTVALAPTASGLVPTTHNSPPPPTPFDAVQIDVLDLEEEARHWLDGGAVGTQDEADAIGRLLDMARQAMKAVEGARKDEKRPLDEQVKAIQERYRPLSERCDQITATCKAALTPWLARHEAEKRAAAEAARREADAKAEAARRAHAEAAVNDLAAQQKAEALLKEAARAEREAGKAERDKASTKGGARAVSLRTRWVVTLADGQAAARHYWPTHRPQIEAALIAIAEGQVLSGIRSIPGFSVVPVQEAV